MSNPIDILNILDGEPATILVLPGDDVGKTPIARTHCEITFQTEDKVLACIDALKQSDEQLKLRPKEKLMYVWDKVYRRGNTIIFGVRWFDRDFFEARKDAFKSAQHASLFARFGVSSDDFKISHEVLA